MAVLFFTLLVAFVFVFSKQSTGETTIDNCLHFHDPYTTLGIEVKELDTMGYYIHVD
jgi:hypothetical protein